MSAYLKVENVTKDYSNGVHVLHSVDLTVSKGSIHVIKGISGSGKSTLLSIMGGMEYPTAGKVSFNNTSLYDLRDAEQAKIRGKSFGFVFQSFQLIPELTVKENIGLPLLLLKREANQQDECIHSIAKMLHIESLLDKFPGFLSGGEQQRVAIARALITEPEILFADEPTGNLDQATSKHIVNIFMELNRKMNLSLVIVTHETDLISAPHYLYSMEKGRLKQINAPV